MGAVSQLLHSPFLIWNLWQQPCWRRSMRRTWSSSTRGRPTSRWPDPRVQGGRDGGGTVAVSRQPGGNQVGCKSEREERRTLESRGKFTWTSKERILAIPHWMLILSHSPSHAYCPADFDGICAWGTYHTVLKSPLGETPPHAILTSRHGFLALWE